MDESFMDEEKDYFRSRYFYLLIALVTFLLVNPFLTDNHLSNLILLIFFTLIMIFSIHSVAQHAYLGVVTAGLALISFFSYWYILWINASQAAYVIHFSLNIIFLSVILFSVISSVAKQRIITADTLFGAICGYLLIGFTWSFIYLLIASIDPTSFSIHMDHDTIRTRIDHFIYYSYVTLTTIGYGDILALKSVARNFSWLEAVVGQVYLAVWISQLVGLRLLQLKP